jgi:hypothetical protein
MCIRSNEQEEAIGALEAVARFLPRVREDPFEWRWVIISLRTALQGFMVVAIRDTAGMFPLPQLVPQDTNDEPASELLKRIAAERDGRGGPISRRSRAAS